MSEWQPIETAPKDESGPSIWLGDTGGMLPCYWRHGEWFHTYADTPIRFIEGFTPTHWMPIPKPPVTP